MTSCWTVMYAVPRGTLKITVVSVNDDWSCAQKSGSSGLRFGLLWSGGRLGEFGCQLNFGLISAGNHKLSLYRVRVLSRSHWSGVAIYPFDELFDVDD